MLTVEQLVAFLLRFPGDAIVSVGEDELISIIVSDDIGWKQLGEIDAPAS